MIPLGRSMIHLSCSDEVVWSAERSQSSTEGSSRVFVVVVVVITLFTTSQLSGQSKSIDSS